MIKKLGVKYRHELYFVFRVLVGLLFLQHGAQKLFGSFGGTSVELFSLIGAVGIVEFFGGLAITLGLFTGWVALIAGIEMLFAYFRVHISTSLIPIINKGELALLYVAAFLVLIAYGSGKHSLDTYLKKRKKK